MYTKLRKIEIASILLLFAGGLTVVGCSGKSPTSSSVEPIPTQYTPIYRVMFPTLDGLTIAASWSTPANTSGNIPVVILIHHFQNSDHLYDDRTIWFEFFGELLSQGYGVMAIDLRGHGESFFTIAPGNMSTEDIDQMILDVDGAISWLKHRSDVDISRIAVVGGNVGANIAYESSGAFREVRTAIALSPLITNPPTLIGTNIPRFAPHSILFMASDADNRAVTAVNQLSESTAIPKRVEIIKDSTTDTFVDDWGIGLIAFHPDARKIALDWLKTTL